MRGSKPGERRGGRAKGSQNKTTRELKEAILQAAEQVGEEGGGEGGLVGYLRRVAKEDVKAFSGLLGQVSGMNGGPIEMVTRVELVDADGDGEG